MSGRRRMIISVPASVSSSSPMVLPSSTFMSSSTRLIQGVSCSCMSIFVTLRLFFLYKRGGSHPLRFIAFENETGVVAAKAHGVGHGYINCRLARFVRHVVKIAIGIGMVQVDGWWYNSCQDGHDGDNGFNCACCSQRMPDH